MKFQEKNITASIQQMLDPYCYIVQYLPVTIKHVNICRPLSSVNNISGKMLYLKHNKLTICTWCISTNLFQENNQRQYHTLISVDNSDDKVALAIIISHIKTKKYTNTMNRLKSHQSRSFYLEDVITANQIRAQTTPTTAYIMFWKRKIIHSDCYCRNTLFLRNLSNESDNRE